MLDAIVIGAGPNGLVAAAYLARAGLSVRVLEAKSEPGGAVRSRELTAPGFSHDLGAAFFPFATASPALAGLDLPGAGLEWLRAEIDSAHPARDGSCASIARDPELAARCFGQDGDAWRKVQAWSARAKDRLLALLLAPPVPLLAALRLGPVNLLRLAEVALSSGRGWSARRFAGEAARRVLPGLALHTDIGPDDACGAAVGFMLAAMAATDGFAVPKGGAGSITRALVRRVHQAGAEIALNARAEAIIVRGNSVCAVKTRDGEIEARAVVADVAAPALYLKLLPEASVPPFVLGAMRRFRHGFGTFKADWALSGPVPWQSADCARAAVVHAAESNDDLSRFVRQVRAGELPDEPYLVIGQQSLVDPSRAPAGMHTLWCYSRVPAARPWSDEREIFADRVEARIEGLAPGFRRLIVARHIMAPPDLEATDENLIGGDLGGGSAQIGQQLIFRPVFPYFRYRTPVRGLYLCSSYAHPGAGVHGACGHNAAQMVLRDLGAR